MKLIDRETGESPAIHNGQSITWESTVFFDGPAVCEIPDAITAEGEEAVFAEISTGE